ncbi:hypothetical protein L210DRAFT_2784554 [Boletus edulis BED1]|uniref:Uncharacterized protein n=1 Tax=Boletus edulis BED1 TaxID=1328754 RepID=A0AAD4GJ44_BOLED|nr:hypothetical protein L210DRAFT_2784554 [Boletus edulis BED1]
MLFDYLIYSTDANITTTSISTFISTATGSSANPSSSLSPTSPVMSGTSSGPNIGAIVGGAVGGISAVAIVVVSLLCYWRYKRRVGGQYHVAEATDMLAPFDSPWTTPTPFDVNALPMHQTPVGLPPTQLGLGGKTRRVTSVTVQPLVPPSSTTPPSASGASNNVTTLVEEIGMLRSEVARLRTRQDRERDLAEVGSVAPPDYFAS